MENNTGKTLKAEMEAAVDKVMDITNDLLIERDEVDYVKILLLLDMYKTGDEFLLDDLLNNTAQCVEAQVTGTPLQGKNGVIFVSA